MGVSVRDPSRAQMDFFLAHIGGLIVLLWNYVCVILGAIVKMVICEGGF